MSSRAALKGIVRNAPCRKIGLKLKCGRREKNWGYGGVGRPCRLSLLCLQHNLDRGRRYKIHVVERRPCSRTRKILQPLPSWEQKHESIFLHSLVHG